MLYSERRPTEGKTSYETISKPKVLSDFKAYLEQHPGLKVGFEVGWRLAFTSALWNVLMACAPVSNADQSSQDVAGGQVTEVTDAVPQGVNAEQVVALTSEIHAEIDAEQQISTLREQILNQTRNNEWFSDRQLCTTEPVMIEIAGWPVTSFYLVPRESIMDPDIAHTPLPLFFQALVDDGELSIFYGKNILPSQFNVIKKEHTFEIHFYPDTGEFVCFTSPSPVVHSVKPQGE